MDYFSNLIYENHNIFLKDFSGISEISNVAESKYAHNLLSGNDRINSSTAFNIFGNNLRTSLTITESKESSNFNDSLFKNFSLQNFIFISCK